MRSVLLVLLAATSVAGCDHRNESQPPATSRPESVVTPPEEPNVALSAPDVPNDPLGLLDNGWRRTLREADDRYVIDDAYLCTEVIDWQAKGLLSIVRENYQAVDQPDTGIEVTYIDYGDAESMQSRLSGLADPVAACAEDPGTRGSIESTSPRVAAGFEAYGYVNGDARSWVVADSEGLAVLFSAVHADADLERSLTGRAVLWMQGS